MVVKIRDNKSAAGKCVDHVSGLFVNLDSVKVAVFSGHLNTVESSREFPNPPQLDLEFSDD